MLDSNLPVSLQYQLRSKLLEKINKKEWPNGALIPSERELCDIYGVSRMTVREVLKDLVAKGVLIRKQGKGTFVAEKKIVATMTSTFSLKADLEDKKIESSFTMLDFQITDTPLYLEEIFNLKDEKIAQIARLRIVGGKKYARETAYVPVRYIQEANEKDIDKNGLYPTMKEKSGLFPETADETIEAVNCPKDIAKDLGLKKDEAVIKIIKRTFYRGICIEYCESFVSGIRYNCHRIF